MAGAHEQGCGMRIKAHFRPPPPSFRHHTPLSSKFKKLFECIYVCYLLPISFSNIFISLPHPGEAFQDGLSISESRAFGHMSAPSALSASPEAAAGFLWRSSRPAAAAAQTTAPSLAPSPDMPMSSKKPCACTLTSKAFRMSLRPWALFGAPAFASPSTPTLPG